VVNDEVQLREVFGRFAHVAHVRVLQQVRKLLGVWAAGKNSSLETDWVGMGERNLARSAGMSFAISSGVSIAVSCWVWGPPQGAGIR
jgi:hypothetical protein